MKKLDQAETPALEAVAARPEAGSEDSLSIVKMTTTPNRKARRAAMAAAVKGNSPALAVPPSSPDAAPAVPAAPTEPQLSNGMPLSKAFELLGKIEYDLANMTEQRTFLKGEIAKILAKPPGTPVPPPAT